MNTIHSFAHSWMVLVLLCITNISAKHQLFVYTQLNDQTFLFLTIQFSISHFLCTIWLLDRTLSGATTPSQSGPGSNGNEGILHISQNSRIGVSPSDGFVPYPDNTLGSYHSAEMQSGYYTAPANWAALFAQFRLFSSS